jgi:hypothetical protein
VDLHWNWSLKRARTCPRSSPPLQNTPASALPCRVGAARRPSEITFKVLRHGPGCGRLELRLGWHIVQSWLGPDSWSLKLMRTPLNWSSSVQVVSEEHRGIVSGRSSALLRGGNSGLQRYRDASATRMTCAQQDAIGQLMITDECKFVPPRRCFLDLDAGIGLDSCW